MPKIFLPLVAACFVVLLTGWGLCESVFVELSDVQTNAPAGSLVVCPLDMTPAANWLAVSRLDSAEFYVGDRRIDAVFVPGSGNSPLRGTFVAVLPDDVPKGKPCRLRIESVTGDHSSRSEQKLVAGSFVFDVAKFGGLPSAMTFADGTTLDTMRWFDRLHDPATGSWDIANDKNAVVELVVDKPFLKVVRTSASFQRADGSTPPSRPKSVYDWFIFPRRELVYVVVSSQQEEPFAWKEKHFLELHIPDGSFEKWFGDGKSGTFSGTKQSTMFNRFAGFLDARNNVIAAIAPGSIVYDGLKDFGPYLLPRGNDAWQAWTDTNHRFTAWYWIGNTSEPTATLQSAYETVRSMPQARIVIPEFEQSVADWKTAPQNDLFFSGKISSKEELEYLQYSRILPENWIVIENGTLGMIVEITDDKKNGSGFRLLSLVDRMTNTILSARESVPLFTMEVLDKETGKMTTLTTDNGWEKSGADSEGRYFVLSNPMKLPGAEKIQVVVMGYRHNNSFNWKCAVRSEVDRYEFRKIIGPQIALRNLGPTMKAFYPHASGVVTENPVGKELRWQGTYPSGWCSMSFTAVYDETRNVGLYIGQSAATDERGGAVKNIRIISDAQTDSLVILFEHPLPLGLAANRVYGASWTMFQGDWYDAAMIQRDVVRRWAEWYPRGKLGPNGRTDTPQWMKELCVWAMCSDPPQQMPETMRKFTDAFGVPTAVHWYNWHQIPFDNDYPHYFPAKDGFKEAVAKIQANGDCYVMPYINGRLWDTRDKGVEDYQFSSVALPGAAKQEDGKPYTETYGSKESDGSNVELAVMCPASDVWKNKVAENIFRLTDDCGVAGVYVDQVAAAQPVSCFDESHGHPLAGGDWWNRAYWQMFEKIRDELPKDKMLTTECNAEPFINIFDGYLTWHFQYQDQVPAFAAVYGGAVQMFGRAYRGGPSQVLADRMKAAEQLVYGEQIGWIDPRVVDDPARFPFFKAIVQTRYKYRDYFYIGEMIRPPKLLDEIPTVTADWQWSGEWNITADAVQTGAWRKTNESGKTVSAVFIFVNVSDDPITSRVAVRLDEIGMETKAFENPLTFEPGVPMAIEVLP